MRRGFDGRRRARVQKPRVRRTGSLARLLQYVPLMLALCLPLMAARGVLADDRILLAELLPALTDTPLGAVDVAAAPLPGMSVTVHRADVLRALTQAGLAGSLKPADIPKSARITREQVAVTRAELSAQAQTIVEDAVAPCELREVRFPNEVRVAAGPREYRGEFNGLHTGSVTGAVYVASGGRTTRVPVVASVTCPPPEVSAGTQLTAIAVVGNVRASAPAEARQPGRRGDVIRIINRATGASLRARVVDARTVEIVP